MEPQLEPDRWWDRLVWMGIRWNFEHRNCPSRVDSRCSVSRNWSCNRGRCRRCDETRGHCVVHGARNSSPVQAQRFGVVAPRSAGRRARETENFKVTGSDLWAEWGPLSSSAPLPVPSTFARRSRDGLSSPKTPIEAATRIQPERAGGAPNAISTPHRVSHFPRKNHICWCRAGERAWPEQRSPSKAHRPSGDALGRPSPLGTGVDPLSWTHPK